MTNKFDDLHLKWNLINNHDHLMGYHGIQHYATRIYGCPKFVKHWKNYNMVVPMRHTMIKTLHFVYPTFSDIESGSLIKGTRCLVTSFETGCFYCSVVAESRFAP